MKAVFRNLFVMLVLTIGTVVSASAQPTVKGKVTDLDGRPLEGVVVVVKGTTNGAMTDVNGNYFISSLKKGDVLVFRIGRAIVRVQRFDDKTGCNNEGRRNFP